MKPHPWTPVPTLNKPTANDADGRSNAGVLRPWTLNLQDCPGNAHLLGIAGSGMRALAKVLCGWGWKLTGSDVSSDAIESVDLSAASIRRGHAAENVPADADIVIHSDAVAADNVELRRAAELGIPTATYFQVAGRLMRRARGIAVAGTHGKSTATAMAARILTDANLDPTVLCGAAALGETDGGRAGGSGLMLVEACEYRRNFLHLRPRAAAILGVEPDHFDCYKTPRELEEAFGLFAGSVETDGVLLVRHDCRASRRAAAAAACGVETFGFDECGTRRSRKRLEGAFQGAARPDWAARILESPAGCYRFQILHRNRPFCDVSLQPPGRHNVLNALAAAALAFHQGVDAGQIACSLAGFRGLCRRMEDLGTWRGVTVLDDYAHHPTEVTAALAAVRQMHPKRRLCCVFQPHQALRTARLLDELAQSLQNVDCLAVADIFRAREGPAQTGQVTAADLADRVGEFGAEVFGSHSMDDIHRELTNHLEPGDVLLTIGAGDIRRIADGYIHRIRENRAAG